MALLDHLEGRFCPINPRAFVSHLLTCAAGLTVNVLCCGCVAIITHTARAMSSNGGSRSTSQRVTEAKCEALVSAITQGEGADGLFAIDMEALSTAEPGDAPIVFLPKGAPDRRPVVFLSHGYGPNYWQAYSVLIHHLVSRGSIVVYGVYPMAGAGNEQRYAALWNSFMVAVRQFGASMDLTRVGFVGHSFGGGATPAIARKGLLEQGWGGKGSFTFVLAPWYSFLVSNAQLQEYPSNLVQVIETYDKDTVNDDRMAIDLYNSSRLPAGQYFFRVRSASVGGCKITADHSTPARNPSLRLKQYAVLRPLDALTEFAFDGSAQALKDLTTMGRPSPSFGYQPLELETSPLPAEPQGHYAFKWNGNANPRRTLQSW